MPTPANKNLENFLFAPVEPSWYKICIEGRIIPRMLGRKQGDRYEVILDDRFVYEFDTIEAAYSACSLAGYAMAIGSGYSWLGAPNKDRPFAPTVMMLGDE